ncbi:MAG: tyrosine-type recombinase/integrase [Rhodocyclaceae bacterium]|nr:tyrosine-type recombinase/integrase [Rhodocyclaceae bacterium]
MIELQASALNDGIEFKLRIDSLLLQGVATKFQRERAIKSCREFLLAIVSLMEQNNEATSPGSIQNIYHRLRVLRHWMWRNEIWQFSQLSAEDLYQFMEYVFHRGDRLVSDKTMAGYQRLLMTMWDVNDQYAASLKVSPYLIPEIERFSKLAPSVGRWKPIGEQNAIDILTAAIEWLDSTTPLLVQLFERLREVDGKSIGKTRSWRKKARVKEYSEIACSDLFAKLCEISGDHRNPNTVIRSCWSKSVGATMVIVLFFTGIRGSELLSLKRECISREKHRSGRVFDYLAGIAAKKGSAPRTWIAPKPVVEAIEKLRRIGEAHVADGTEYLFYKYNGNGCVPVRGAKIRRMANTQLATAYVGIFVRSCSKKIVDGLRRSFHLHQARKTFATFVAVRDKSSLGPLAAHYGHASTFITDSRYVGSDLDLHQLIGEASRADLANGLTDLLTSQSLGGLGGETFEKYRTLMPVRFKGRTMLKKSVEDLIEQGANLSPCDWGYCLYAADTSACRGDASGPSLERRSPSVCRSCKNFAVTEKHRRWWEERHRRESDFIKLNPLSEQARAICASRLEETEELLVSLNQKRLVREE